MGFVSGVAAVSSARRAPSAVCTRSSFAGAAVVAAPVARATMRMSNIQETIQTEIAKAKEASEKFGKTSKEAAAAWYALRLVRFRACLRILRTLALAILRTLLHVHCHFSSSVPSPSLTANSRAFFVLMPMIVVFCWYDVMLLNLRSGLAFVAT